MIPSHQNKTTQHQHQRGITLLELLATLGITAILSIIAAPNIVDIKTNLAVTADKSSLLTLLKSSRARAITDNTYTSICHLDNNQCVSFSSPLTAFIDQNNNQVLDGSEKIIASIKINNNAGVNWNHYKRIKFEASGRAGGSNGTLRYCAQGKGFSLVISRTGRIRTSTNDQCG